MPFSDLQDKRIEMERTESAIEQMELLEAHHNRRKSQLRFLKGITLEDMMKINGFKRNLLSNRYIRLFNKPITLRKKRLEKIKEEVANINN